MGEIRFVGIGETRGYPYLVCKKVTYLSQVGHTDDDAIKMADGISLWHVGHHDHDIIIN